MKHLYTVAGDITNLADTMLEGLQHMKKRMEEGQLRETLFLFEDVLEALESIEAPMRPLMEKETELGAATSGMKQSLEMLARAYEENNRDKALNELQNSLLPAFQKFQEELDNSLKKYKDS